MPDEYAARGRNKYRYRYPRGESYEDIAQRLEPVIIELMRTKAPVLIVSHQATLRVLYAYLTDKQPESCPEELIPPSTPSSSSRRGPTASMRCDTRCAIEY